MSTLQHTRKDYLVFWGACLGFALFFGYVLLSAGVMRNRYMNQRVVNTVYMTNWELYTASPFGPINQLYSVEKGSATLVDIRPFTPTYLFGINRMPKIIGEEITIVLKDSMLMQGMKPHRIVMPYGETIGKYINPDTLQYTAVSKPNILHLQGKYLIAVSKTPTWQQRRVGGIVDTVNVYAVNLSRQ